VEPFELFVDELNVNRRGELAGLANNAALWVL